jgi:alcohol dehydrogenase class IV
MGKALNLDLKGMKPQEIKNSIVAEIDRLKRSVGIQKSLGELGIKRTDIPTLAQKALKDPCMVTNPRVPTQRDIEVIYEEAL